MKVLLALLNISIFLAIVIGASKYFYFTYLKRFTTKILHKYNYTLDDLKYSFEEIIYFVTLPTNNPLIINSSLDDLYIEKEFISHVYPTINGLKIILKTPDSRDMLVAYLARDKFRIPLLEKMVYVGKIDSQTYTRMTAYKLVHPHTINEIKEEVHRQLKSKRY
ncbi:hypothetical protein [Halothermothrix orenii]|uniref:Uncharacterized protein n=1 Tax=Halothermothrix orenii (strain H 168 / OCM 544 / DSM 9562) TaxID=373903 RepID=B8D026_HALOH|nr:hypothetical protein [Halothermothrix orenii]ACL70878.1 hypothetical protein Hore_21330 [Halothermothrix orenii H 168]